MKLPRYTDWSALAFLLLAGTLPLVYIWQKNRTAQSMVAVVDHYVEDVESEVRNAASELEASGARKTEFEETVAKHFSSWIRGEEGVLSLARTNELLRDPTVKGDQAAALAAIHDYFRAHDTHSKHKQILVLA